MTRTADTAIPPGPADTRQGEYLCKIFDEVYELKRLYEQIAARVTVEIDRLAHGVGPDRGLGRGHAPLADAGDAMALRGRIEARIDAASSFGVTQEQIEYVVSLGGLAQNRLDERVCSWLYSVPV